MGFFSSLFGGGSSSSSSTNNTNVTVNPVTNVTVKPNNNITIETEDIANAITSANDKDLAQQLAIEQKKLKLTEQELTLSERLLILQEELSSLNFLKDLKTKEQITLLTILVGSVYFYKKLKKGGNK